MLVESVCIVMILLVIMFFFLRKGRKDYTIATIPLLIVPGVTALTNIVIQLIRYNMTPELKSGIVIVALVIAVILMALVTQKLKTKKSKTVYLISCAGFSTILTFIYMYNFFVM